MMTTQQWLQDLHTHGVQVALSDGRVHVTAPQGVLNAEMRRSLRERREEVLAWLLAEGQPVLQSGHSASPSLVRVTCAETFLQEVTALSQELRTMPKQIALDLETTGLKARQHKVVSIALGVSGRVSILDLRPYYALSTYEQAAWRAALQGLLHRVFEDCVTWVGQNLKFDWHFLAHHFGVRLDPVYDTMLVEQVLHGMKQDRGRVSFSLREIAARYQIPVSKEERSWFEGLDERPAEWAAPFPDGQLRYMVQDIEVPYRLAQLQQPLLEQHHLQKVAEIEQWCLPALASIESHGVLIDRERWQQALACKQTRQAELEKTLVTTLSQALDEARKQQALAFQQYQQERQVEEKRLMQVYTTSDSIRRSQSWEAFLYQELRPWLGEYPEPPKPSSATNKPINLGSSAQLIAALA